MQAEADVVVIGAGVVGCAIARELCRFEASVLVLEKEHDVAQGASGRNSGVVHSGFNAPPGSLKAKLNVAGSRMFADLCRKLKVPYREIGTLVVARREEEVPELLRLLEVGRANGVSGLTILNRQELRKREPQVQGVAALFSPRGAITSPYALNIALAENAQANGARFCFLTQVTGISKRQVGGPGTAWEFVVHTTSGDFRSRCVVNAAGIWADRIARLSGSGRYRQYPCRGEYLVLDKYQGGLVQSMVYPVPHPGSGGLGIHLTPTVDGNLLVGPSAEFIRQREDYRTTWRIQRRLESAVREFLPGVDRLEVIASYAGVRCKLTPPGSRKTADFVIQESPQLPGFFDLVGIESPGLTSAPAIGRYVARMIRRRLSLAPKSDFDPCRPQPDYSLKYLAKGEEELVAQQAGEECRDWEVVCRCEQVTRREVVAALRNPLGVRSLSAIKYRCRAGMGRCQGSFCLPRIVRLWNELFPGEVPRLKGPGSELFAGATKEARRR